MSRLCWTLSLCEAQRYPCHSCDSIVVCMSSMPYLNRNHGPFWNKNAAHGLTQALVSLHATGIVHGGALSLSFCKGYRSPTLDLNIGNFSFAFPQIADQDPSDVIQDLAGDHDMIAVLPISVFHQTHPCRLMSSPHVTLQNIMTRSLGKMSLRQK